jgi:hypothetical protein
MNDDPDTFIIDHDPAKLLPYSKRLVPEDEQTEQLPKRYQPSDPRLFGENYQ